VWEAAGATAATGRAPRSNPVQPERAAVQRPLQRARPPARGPGLGRPGDRRGRGQGSVGIQSSTLHRRPGAGGPPQSASGVGSGARPFRRRRRGRDPRPRGATEQAGGWARRPGTRPNGAVIVAPCDRRTSPRPAFRSPPPSERSPAEAAERLGSASGDSPAYRERQGWRAGWPSATSSSAWGGPAGGPAPRAGGPLPRQLACDRCVAPSPTAASRPKGAARAGRGLHRGGGWSWRLSRAASTLWHLLARWAARSAVRSVATGQRALRP